MGLVLPEHGHLTVLSLWVTNQRLSPEVAGRTGVGPAPSPTGSWMLGGIHHPKHTCTTWEAATHQSQSLQRRRRICACFILHCQVLSWISDQFREGLFMTILKPCPITVLVTLFPGRVLWPWPRLPRTAVAAPSLAVSKARLERS